MPDVTLNKRKKTISKKDLLYIKDYATLYKQCFLTIKKG